MDPKWIDFFKQLGITSAWIIFIAIIIGFLSKKLFEFFIDNITDLKKAQLNKDLEVYKQDLSIQAQIHNLELDKALEGYKNSLQQISQEHQIRFSRLHSDRAETIKTLFSKLVKMEVSMSSFMAPFQSTNEPTSTEKSNIAATDGNDFLNFYRSNEILFNDKTCEIIDQLDTKFRNAYIKHLSHLRRENNPNYSPTHSQGEDPYFDILKNEVPKLKKLLIEDFRTTLGVL